MLVAGGCNFSHLSWGADFFYFFFSGQSEFDIVFFIPLAIHLDRAPIA